MMVDGYFQHALLKFYPALYVGVPSGHVMISTAVLLTCTHYFYPTKHPSQPTSTGGANHKKDAALAFTRMCVLLFGVVIGLTRVLISSHFIHQVECVCVCVCVCMCVLSALWVKVIPVYSHKET